MANKEAILDKIARNMKQRGLSAERVGETVEFTKAGGAGDVLVVSYKDKEVQKPMGGVDDQASPFLGIGVAAPGSIKIKGAATENTVAAIFDDGDALELLAECSGHANDLVIEEGDTTTEITRIRGQADVLGLGH
jgi:hypothetical protein